MDYNKYSKNIFLKRGLNSIDARRLADELQSDVLDEMQSRLLENFKEIVSNLNLVGHDLQPDEINLGDIAFKDRDQNGKCYLRLGCDLIISAGFAHVIENEDNLNFIDAWFENKEIPGVSFSLNDSIIVTSGELKGKRGAIVSLLDIKPNVMYLIEDGSGNDFKVIQEEISHDK
jgi:hypothetical protein